MNMLPNSLKMFIADNLFSTVIIKFMISDDEPINFQSIRVDMFILYQVSKMRVLVSDVKIETTTWLVDRIRDVDLFLLSANRVTKGALRQTHEIWSCSAFAYIAIF